MKNIRLDNYAEKYQAFTPGEQITMQSSFHEAGHAGAYIFTGGLDTIENMSIATVTRESIDQLEKLGNIRRYTMGNGPLHRSRCLPPDRKVVLKLAFRDSIGYLAGYVAQNKISMLDPKEMPIENYQAYEEGVLEDTEPFCSEPGLDLYGAEQTAWLLYPEKSHDGRRYMFMSKSFKLAEELLDVPEVWRLVEDMACQLFNKKYLDKGDLLKICLRYLKTPFRPILKHPKWRWRFRGIFPDRSKMKITETVTAEE